MDSIRNSAGSSSQAIFPTLTPCLLCSSPTLQEITSPSSQQPLSCPPTFISLCGSAGRTDARESRQRRTNLSRHTSHLRPPRALPSIPFYRSATSPVILLSLPTFHPASSSRASSSAPAPSLNHFWLGCRQRCRVGSSMGLVESSGTKQSNSQLPKGILTFGLGRFTENISKAEHLASNTSSQRC